jgi:hypothetical protein
VFGVNESRGAVIILLLRTREIGLPATISAEILAVLIEGLPGFVVPREKCWHLLSQIFFADPS